MITWESRFSHNECSAVCARANTDDWQTKLLLNGRCRTNARVARTIRRDISRAWKSSWSPKTDCWMLSLLLLVRWYVLSVSIVFSMNGMMNEDVSWDGMEPFEGSLRFVDFYSSRGASHRKLWNDGLLCCWNQRENISKQSEYNIWFSRQWSGIYRFVHGFPPWKKDDSTIIDLTYDGTLVLCVRRWIFFSCF